MTYKKHIRAGCRESCAEKCFEMHIVSKVMNNSSEFIKNKFN